MTPREINEMLVGQIESILPYLLPNGIKRGNEWVVGSPEGEPGKSTSIRMSGGKAGVWCDFADAGRGGDLLDLWCQAKGISFVDALKEAKAYLGIEDDKPKFYRKKKKYKKPQKVKVEHCRKQEITFFAGRGISESTVKTFKIGSGNDAIAFPYISPCGELELVKYRAISEKKFWSNEAPIPCLFGWQAISDNDKDVVICEGEIDALTFFEQGIVALSVPKGAGAGGKQDWIEYEFERLERFANVFICMDMDDAGRQAVTEIIDRLGRHRCKVVDLHCFGTEYGDPNEVHMSGAKLRPYLERAVTYDPEELVRLVDFHDEILADLNCDIETAKGLFLPWSKSRQDVKLFPGGVTVWAGINGHGKSLVVSHVIADGVSQGEKFCVASMEMPPADFGSKLYRQLGWYRGCRPELTSGISEFVNGGIWLFNSYGTAKADKILSVFHYARKRYGITQFVIDSLAKCGFSEDDYSGQKGYVDRLMDFALESKIHIHLVCHVRKQGDESTIPNKFSIKGTGAIIDMVNNAFIVWRNKEKETKRSQGIHVSESDPDVVIDCVKQKKTGKEPRFAMWFHKPSHQFVENFNSEPRTYIDLRQLT